MSNVQISSPSSSRKPRNRKNPNKVFEDGLATPTPEQIAAAVASIDQSAENAVTSDIIDHGTQIGSWKTLDDDVVLEQALLTVEGTLGSTEIPAEYASAEFGHMGSDEVTMAVSDALIASEQIETEVANQTAPKGWTEVEGGAEIIEGETPKAQTLQELIEAQDQTKIDETVFYVSNQLTAREDFERTKSEATGTDNIQRTLKKVRSQMVTKKVASVLLATNVNPDFINRELHTGSKYNVYALGKLADLMFGVSGGAVSNAINIAIMKSLFALRGKGILFTGEVAKACCSKQWKIDAAISKHLVRYTVSTSTAPTQASSTMSALTTLGVVRAEGSARNPTYILQEDHPITKKLEELLAA